MTNKKILALILTILVLGGTYIYITYSDNKTSKDTVYNINSQQITLKDVEYFGNEVKYDFDGDGRMDTAFILTQNTGGSGTFYYLVVTLNTARGYVGSKAYLLGDRIAPQTTEMSKDPATPDVIVVNYADRKPGEPFTTQPSVGKSVWLKFDTKTIQLGEVVQNFEGEADPVKMTLGMKTWNWVRTTYNDGKVIVPKTNKFMLTLKSDKTFSASTDCNGVGGEYVLSGDKITLNKMMSTLMYCEGSQEGEYSKMLSEVQSYHFTSKGELVFDFKTDTGSMIFK